MLSMKRPSRGERASAATTRYDGCFFLPMRLRRSLTATRSLLVETLGELGHELLRAAQPLGPLAEHLHHLLHVLELLQQLVDLGGGHPAAVGDPQPPRAVDDRWITAFVRRHGADDRLDPGDVAIVDLGVLQ